MLFLPPSKEPYDQDLREMVERSSLRKARVFVNLDHLHVGEYTLLKQKLVQPDMLHPEDGKRSPNAWIIMDLLQRLDESPKG